MIRRFSNPINGKIQSGLSPDEARRRALIELGGVEQVKEQVRESRTGAWLDDLRQDVRYGFRSLMQSRAFVFTVIGSLSIGIAANVAAFAFINAWLFRPYPGVGDQESLVEIRVYRGCEGLRNCWYPTSEDYRIIRDAFSSLGGVASFASADVAVATSEVRSMRASFVSENYFDVLRVRPGLGRTFSSVAGRNDPATDAVAVISDGLWMREFGADPSVIQ
jgi:hypothetical protein